MKGYKGNETRSGGIQLGFSDCFDCEISGWFHSSEEGSETGKLFLVGKSRGKKGRDTKIIPSVVVQIGIDGANNLIGIIEVDANSDIWRKLSDQRPPGEIPSEENATALKQKVWEILLRLVSGISKKGRATYPHTAVTIADENKEKSGS